MNNQKNGGAERAVAPPRPDVAVYLDFENLYVSLKTTVKMDPNFDLLMEKCREFGRVTVARAYADWSEFKGIVASQMFANGFEPVYVPTRKFYDAKTRAEARKNSVDIHITIDIVKSLFMHENVDTFILISGDRDYVPLINQIRQHGKSVYAIGVAGCTSSELSAAVDDMFFYHQLLVEDHESAREVDVYNQLMRAIRLARRRGYPTTLGILKPILKELVEGFDERNYKNSRGVVFPKFKDLILDAQDRRLVRLVTTGAVSEVYLWGEEPTKVGAPARRDEGGAPARRDESARGGRGRRERGQPRPGLEQRPATEAPGGEEEPIAAEANDLDTAAVPGYDDDEMPVPAASGAGQAESAEEPAASAYPAESDAPSSPIEGDRPAGETEADRLTGFALDEASWGVVRKSVESFGERPPSPRKLLGTLRGAREDGLFGQPGPTDGDLQELVRQSVETGRLERVRKGFSTVYRLRDIVPSS